MKPKTRLICDLAIIVGAFVNALGTDDHTAKAIYFACAIVYVIHVEKRP